MSDARTIEYQLKVNTDNFKTGITAATQAGTGGFMAMIAGAKAFYFELAIATAGISAIVGAMVKMYNEYSIAEQAALKLSIAQKNAGIIAQQNKMLFDAQTASLEKLTTAEDDEIVALQELSLNMGATGNETLKAVEGAIGLKAAFGIELNTALKMTINGFAGNYDQLGRYVPAIRNATSETQKLAEFQKVLANSFIVARKEVGSTRGQLEQMWKVLMNLMELGGKIITQLIEPFIYAFTKLGEAILYVVNGIDSLLTSQKELEPVTKAATAEMNKQVTASEALLEAKQKLADLEKKSIEDVIKYRDEVSTSVETAKRKYEEWSITLIEAKKNIRNLSTEEINVLDETEKRQKQKVIDAIAGEKKITDEKRAQNKQNLLDTEAQLRHIRTIESNMLLTAADEKRQMDQSSQEFRLKKAQEEIRTEKEKEEKIKEIKEQANQKWREDNEQNFEYIRSGYDVLSSGISNFISVGLAGGNALVAMASAFKNAFISAIAQIITKLIVMRLLTGIFDMVMPGSSSLLGGALGLAGAKANGGSVSGGLPYLVGERGAEIFTPQTSGTIIPNNAIGMSDARLAGIEKAIRISDINNITAQKKFRSLTTVVDRLNAANAETIATFANMGNKKIAALI